ncbi:hypothetical protein Anas_08084, partial [Armadillidium nasatum]
EVTFLLYLSLESIDIKNDRNYINKSYKRNLEDIVITETATNYWTLYTPTLVQGINNEVPVIFLTTIFDFENTRYCALPSREESYRLIPFAEESRLPIEDKMSNPKVFYYLNISLLLKGASLDRIFRVSFLHFTFYDK